ncbi:MAG: PA14 domain-containing protein [Verrucomicrobiota bacterium]
MISKSRFLAFLSIVSCVAISNAEPPEWAATPDQTLEFNTLLGQMKYSISEFEAEPGAKIKIVLDNTDDLQHNLVFLKPDDDDKDGQKFALECWNLGEKGIELGWVPPNHSRVLAASTLLDPHADEDIYLQLPDETGEYPYICTVPGHSLMMRGVIKVNSNKKFLADLSYKIYEGSWQKLPDFSSLKPVSEGKSPDGLIDIKLAKKGDNYGMVFNANFEIPKTGDYEFEMGSDDGSQLIIDGENEILIDGVHPPQFQKKKLKLEEGIHSMEVRYFEAGGGEEFYFTVKGKPIGGLVNLSKMKRGGGASKAKQAPTPIPILPEFEGEAVMYRNFIAGSNPRGIAVGYPGGVNICWDADLMNVVMIWRGGFMDGSRHWNGRGQGAQPPAGFDVGKPAIGFPLQVITPESAQWQKEYKGTYIYDRDNPESKSERSYIEQHPDYQFIGYRLDEKRFPTFNYKFQQLQVSDRFEPKEYQKDVDGIERTVKFSGEAADGTTFRIAENVTEAEDGWYEVGDAIKIKAEGSEILANGGNKQLIVPIAGDKTVVVQYSWKSAIGGKVSANLGEWYISPTESPKPGITISEEDHVDGVTISVSF